MQLKDLLGLTNFVNAFFLTVNAPVCMLQLIMWWLTVSVHVVHVWIFCVSLL